MSESEGLILAYADPQSAESRPGAMESKLSLACTSWKFATTSVVGRAPCYCGTAYAYGRGDALRTSIILRMVFLLADILPPIK